MGKSEFGLWTCFFLAVDMGLDLGKEAVERLGRGDCPLKGMSLPKSHNVFQRVLETNAVGRAVRAQQLHAGGGKIRFKAGHVNLLSTSWRHVQLLRPFEG